MKRFGITILIYLFFINVTLPAYAGLNNDVNSFMNSVGAVSNFTSGGSYKTSSGTAFSGGSMSMRFRQPRWGNAVTLQSPSLSVSCNGIDFNAGLISIMNLDTMEKLLSQSGTSLAWGIMVGLMYSLPTIGNVFATIQEWARKIQQILGNTCAIGTEIGKSIGSSIAQHYADSKKSEDVASGATTDFNSAMEKIWDDPSGFSKKTQANITYDVITALGEPTDLAQALQYVLGTVAWYPTGMSNSSCTISSPESAKIIFEVKAAQIAENPKDTINKLVSGGNMNIWKCGIQCNNSCNGLTEDTTSIDGIKKNINTALTAIVMALAQKQSNTDDNLKYMQAPVFPEFVDYMMYLAVKQRAQGSVISPDISDEIDTISTYYSYWILEYMVSYINAAISNNIDKILQNKNADDETKKEVMAYRSDFSTRTQGFAKIFKEQRSEFMNSVSQYNDILKITKSQFVMSKFTMGFQRGIGNFNN